MSRNLALAGALVLGVVVAGVWIASLVFAPVEAPQTDGNVEGGDVPPPPVRPGRSDEPPGDPDPDPAVRDPVTVDPSPKPPVELSKKPPLLIPGFEGPLGEVDWSEVGHAVPPLVRALREMALRSIQNDPMTPKLEEQVSGNHARLDAVIAPVMRQFSVTVPGAVFTHPAFAVNALAVSLEASGNPLDEKQSRQLRELAVTFSEENRRRLDGLPRGAYVLDRIRVESQVRDEFFVRVRGLLRQDQRRVTGARQYEDRVGLDLFSGSWVFDGTVALVGFPDPDGLAGELHGRVVGEVGAVELVADRGEELLVHLTSWAETLPARYRREPGKLDRAGYVKLDHARDAAERTADLLRDLAEFLGFGDLQLTMARQVRQVFVPMR